MTTRAGNAYNCDGVFLDTIDTAAPDTWGTEYEWTSPGMQAVVQRIRTNYVGKVITANRGLFFYDPNLFALKKEKPTSVQPRDSQDHGGGCGDDVGGVGGQLAPQDDPPIIHNQLILWHL